MSLRLEVPARERTAAGRVRAAHAPHEKPHLLLLVAALALLRLLLRWALRRRVRKARWLLHARLRMRVQRRGC